MELKYYKCSVCGNIINHVEERRGEVVCCGQPMNFLNPNTTDASTEKHVPFVKVNGNVVEVLVGEVPHPMVPEHYISWISIETNLGSQIKHLDRAGWPVAKFVLSDGEKLKAVYEYCNLHSLWVKKFD